MSYSTNENSQNIAKVSTVRVGLAMDELSEMSSEDEEELEPSYQISRIDAARTEKARPNASKVSEDRWNEKKRTILKKKASNEEKLAKPKVTRYALWNCRGGI